MFLFTFSNLSAQIVSPSDLFVNNCNDQIDISTLISDPSFTLDLVAEDKISGTGYNYSFPVLSIFPGALDGPFSYGVVTFQVPQTGEIVEITIYECCDAPSFDYIVTIESVNQLPGYSGVFSGQTFLILDELRINDFTQFDGCVLYFGNDAKITVQGGMQLFIENQSELKQYCKYRWDGILAESSATEIRFVDSEITGSARGFFLENNVNFETTNGTFLDNTISIATLNFTTGGPYPGSSYVNVDGGRFEYGWIPVLAFHPNTTLFIEMDKLLYTPTAFTSAQVYISESNGVQIGIGSNTTNTFEVADDASVLSLASEATVANNYFFNCASAIYAEESILIVGGISTEQNTFEKSSFFLTNGAQYLQSNFLNQGSGTIQFPTNQTVNGQTGTSIFDNSAANNSNLIVVGQNNVERRVHIFNNNPWLNSAIQVEDIPTFSLATGVLIESNIFTSSNGPMGTPYQLALKNTAGVRVGGNSFEDHPPVAGTPAIRQPAIYAEDIRGGQIKDNDFYHRHIGFHGVGNLGAYNSEDFLISCNRFTHNETCMLLDATTISIQAVVGGVNFPVANRFFYSTSIGTPFISINNLGSSFNYTYPVAPSPIPFFNECNPQPGTGYLAMGVNFITDSVNNEVNGCGVLNKTSERNTLLKAKLFPNPVKNKQPIIIESTGELATQFVLKNLAGAVLIDEKLIGQKNEIHHDLPSGIYFYTIFIPALNDAINGKLIVQ